MSRPQTGSDSINVRSRNNAAVHRLFHRTAARSDSVSNHAAYSAAHLVGTTAIRKPPQPAWAPVHARPEPRQVADDEDGRVSCAVLQRRIASHEVGVASPPKCAEDRTPLAAYHHALAIVRHERTLPRRRAVDAYVQLTGAQVGAVAAVPNGYTADKLAQRYDGRWPMDNAHRQQLVRGEPLMSRVIRGDYYHHHHHMSPSSATAAHSCQGRSHSVNVIAANKRDVRITSRINADLRARSSAPRGACPCR